MNLPSCEFATPHIDLLERPSRMRVPLDGLLKALDPVKTVKQVPYRFS
jgi:hypothetical protein